MDPDGLDPACELLVGFGTVVRAGPVREIGVLLVARLLVLSVERRLGGGGLKEDGADAPDVGRGAGEGSSLLLVQRRRG